MPGCVIFTGGPGRTRDVACWRAQGSTRQTDHVVILSESHDYWWYIWENRDMSPVYQRYRQEWLAEKTPHFPSWSATVISDEQIRELYQSGQRTLASHPPSNAPLNSQFYRGIGSHFWQGQTSGSCERHMQIFNRFNAIPRYCFSCYKVYIEPRSVIELLKLMVVFHAYNFPDKNTRKCIIELREHVSGAYKGFVYCRGLEAGRKMSQLIRILVSQEISPGVPVTLKRGCTEYAQAYPEYSPADAEGNYVMEYNEDWQQFEDLVDKQRRPVPENQIIKTYDQDSWTLEDARIMYGWLCYAAMIGDSSYLKISGTPLPTTANISRSEPFVPVDED